MLRNYFFNKVNSGTNISTSNDPLKINAKKKVHFLIVTFFKDFIVGV